MPCTTSNRMKLLSILVLTLLLICQPTDADVYGTVIDPKAKEFGNRVCTNKACTQQAARFLLHRDETVNPCEDFVKYTCGKYEFYNDKQPMHSLFTAIDKQVNQILKEPPSPNEKSYNTFTKLLYQKCLDKDSLKASRKAAIVPLLDEIGGWPLLKPQWTEFTSSYEEFIAAIHQKYKKSAFFEVKIQPMVTKTATANLLMLTPVEHNLLPNVVKELALELGAQNPSLDSDIDAFMTQIDAEAKKLYQQHSKSKKMVGHLNDLKGKFPNFNLQKYIDRLFQGVTTADPTINIIIQNADYFKNIDLLFKGKREFANYAVSVVANQLSTLDNPPGSNALNPEGACLKIVLDELTIYPTTQMYAQKHFNRDDVAPEISEMLKVLSEELKDVLNKVSWLDDTTRSNALEKLSYMTNSIGYPENLFDDTYIEENWSIPFDPSDSFYTLAARMGEKWIATIILKQADRPLDRVYWGVTPLVPNAVYNRLQNKIVVPLSVLRHPFYNQNVPKYLNYAAIGHTLAHEISHGYDSGSRLHDKHGYKNNWWTPATSQQYDDKAQCFVKQFNDAGFDGQLSLGENIADNEGLKIAYHAYKKLVANLPEPEHALPGFEEFTLDQMFFITLANSWCDIVKQVRLDANDPHPPSSLRITMMMRNMKEFSNAFGCSNTAKMNPATKCAIW